MDIKLIETKINKEYNLKIKRIKFYNSEIFLINKKTEEYVFLGNVKTFPPNGKGMSHIIEHSVLCGSKNYPLKDPFSTISKTSLVNFINAFTFKDKTIYPFSTSNKKEFFKILDIYLDSMLMPNFLMDKSIFLQEGIRLELIDENRKKLKFNGIVFNEMLGAYSSLEDNIFTSTNKELFKDTIYEYDSGGNPLEIIKLSYEEILNYYLKNYILKNMKFYFYGNLTKEFEKEILNYMKNKINKYIKFKKDLLKKPEIRKIINKRFNNKKLSFIKKESKKIINKKINYFSNEKNKIHFIISFVINKNIELKEIILSKIFKKYLEFDNSLLQNNIIKKGLSENVDILLNDEIYQNQIIFNFIINNDNKIKKVKNEFDKVIKTLSANLDETNLKKAFNEIKFNYYNNYNEDFGTLGIKIIVDMLKINLYHNDKYSEILNYKKIFNEVNKNLTKEFKRYIEKYYLKNKNRINLIMVPTDKNIIEEKLKEEIKKIEKKLTKKDIEKINKENLLLKQFQNKEENEKEYIKTINLKDIKKEINYLYL